MNPVKSFLLIAGLSVLVIYTDGGFNNNPGTVYVHENEDYVKNLWTINADCNIQYTCSTTCSSDCSYRRCSWWSCSYIYQICYRTCYTTCSTTVTCDSCSLTNDASMFQMSGKTVQKVACSSPGCGPTCSAYGCLNAYESYPGTVACWRSSYPSMTNNGRITASFTMSVTENAAPTFYFSNGNLIHVSKSSASVGTTVNRMVASDSDAYIDGDSITYSLISGPRASWIHGNTLFGLTSGGLIQVISDLSYEFSYTFEMVVTVHDRRNDTTTGTLSISLWACYQTPNCTDQSTTIWDTHGSYTGNGTTDTIFDMIYPNPTNHFPNFRSYWHQLQWTFVWTQNSHSNIAQNYYSGRIYSTGNLSIFPAYPSKDFSLVVTVGNSESCYTTTCQMDFTIYFTNWDISIENLPATYNYSEDNDSELLVHSIVTYDYNNYLQDNVTCFFTSISPDERNMFEIRNKAYEEGYYSYNSFEVWRLACQTPLCGFKYSPAGAFLCYTDIGCFNYDINPVYTLYIKCQDAYGSEDNSYITVDIIENKAPIYRNLALTITLDTDALAHYDTIFSVLYTDNENENLIYEHTFGPVDYLWFNGSTYGNYYNNLANITMTTYQWNTTGNATYTDEICGHERRNEICSTLTIRMHDNCGTNPDCADQSIDVTTEFTVGGKLFDVSVTTAHTSCTYSFSSDKPEYFAIDQNTGEITTAKALYAGVARETYTLVAYVYHESSCGYGACTHTVNVDPVNYPISIDNLGVSFSIHEDTTIETTLIRLQTSDQNTGDDVNCDVSSISPDPLVTPPLFFEKETYAGSNVYEILSRASPGFTSATTMYTVTVECNDGRGSSDIGQLTVNIDLNQPPTLVNLDNAVNKDPFSVQSGDEVYVVSASDTENDDITYNCYVANTWVPFECSSQQLNYIVMRRDVDIQTENNAAYDITVCIGDAKHVNNSCGKLTVTFTSSVTYPVISNLPSTTSVAENTAAQTSIFQLAVTDPDANDYHTFLLTSSSPAGSLSDFRVDPSDGIVYTNKVFDYESETHFTLTFTVKDQNLQSTENWDLNITITNVNEGPTLTVTNSTITFAENTAAGTVLMDPGFSCTDPDNGETLTYSFTGFNASAFSQSTSNGLLTLNTAWDLENAAYPSSTTLTVVCTDSGGLSSTVVLTIEVTAVNEFPPTLTVVYPLGSTPQITSATSLASVFLIITATDADVFDDGIFTMDVIKPDNTGTGTYASRYFYVNQGTSLTGGARGELKLSRAPVCSNNITFTVIIKVSDGESPELFSTVQITITCVATEQTTEGKTTKCMTCTSNGKVLIAVIGIEGALVLLIGAHIVWNFACRKNAVSRLPKSYGKRSTRSPITGHQFRSLGPTPSVGTAGSVSRDTVSISLPVSIANSRPGRSIEISDESSLGSDSDSDVSLPQSSRQSGFQSEVGRRGFSVPGSVRATSGLPPPMYASPVQSAASTGLPKPVYSSNAGSVSRPSVLGSSTGNSVSGQTSRVLGTARPAAGANPFSNPDLFRPNYA